MLANSEKDAWETFDRRCQDAIREKGTVNELSLSVDPVHRKTNPDWELPAGCYCYYVREKRAYWDRHKKAVVYGKFAIGCVVFSRSEGCWVRGISICSDIEPCGFNRVEAKRKAYLRLVIAKRHGHGARLFALAPVHKAAESFRARLADYRPELGDLAYKAAHDVELTEFERRRVMGRGDKDDIAALKPTKGANE